MKILCHVSPLQFVYPTPLLYDQFEQVLYPYFLLRSRLLLFIMLSG